MSSYFTPTDQYIWIITSNYGLRQNDRVLVRGSKKFGTVIGLRREAFIILPRFLVRLDQRNKGREQIIKEFYMTELLKV